MNVCGDARDADELLQRLPSSKADVAVVDVNMPGCTGPEIVRKVRKASPSTRVVVFTMYGEDAHAVGFLREGASAFINKRRPIEELLKAIRKAAEGGRYVTTELADYLFQNQIDVQKHPLDLLSAREVLVVRHLAAGKRATEIALDLGISTSTVNTFVERVKTKLGLRTVVEVVQFAQDNGLLG